MRVVSQEEQRKYLAKANKLLRDVATLILERGMRPEEVFTIRKENVHLTHGYVFVPIGKTRFARRNIPRRTRPRRFSNEESARARRRSKEK